MRPVAVAPLDRLVGMNQVLPRQRTPSGRTTPSRDVRLVLIGDAERKTIERGRTLWREVKNELVAVVQETIAVDRLVVTDGQIAREPGGSTGRFPVDGDRLDPVNDVLQLEVRPDRLCDVERGPRVASAWRRRSGRANHSGARTRAAAATHELRPLQVVRPRQRVLVLAVVDAEVVWRRRDDDVHALRRLLTKYFEAVSEVEAARGARTTGNRRKGLEEDCHSARPCLFGWQGESISTTVKTGVFQ